MKKLLMLCLMPNAMLLAMETIDNETRNKIETDRLFIISLIEAYVQGKLSIKSNQICFEKYNYKLMQEHPNDANQYSVKMDSACTALSGMSKEMRKNLPAAVKYYNEGGKELLKDVSEQWRLTLETIRLGKFCLNQDLPSDESEKEKNATIIAKRQRWHDAFDRKDHAAINACLKDLSFASKLRPLLEEEKAVLNAAKEGKFIPIESAMNKCEESLTPKRNDEYKVTEEQEKKII